MQASSIKCLSDLEEVKFQFKKIYVDQSLEHEAVKDLIAKGVGDSR